MRKYAVILFCMMTQHVSAYAQDNGSNNFIEKIYVHTDKELYHTGEILWFRMYVVDGYLHKPVNLSKVGYVEVLDASNRPVLQGKVSLDSSGGKGSFLVPANIASGRYVLRAYTRWMKNFGPAAFFERDITLINVRAPYGTRAVTVRKEHKSTSGKKIHIVIKPDKPIYGLREKAIMDITSTDENGRPVAANMSVAVYKLDSLNRGLDRGIDDYLLSVTGEGESTAIKYEPEFRGHIVEGIIKNSRTNTPAGGITGYISVPGRHSIFSTGVSDSSGRVKVELSDFYGDGELIAQTNTLTDSLYKLEIQDPFSPLYPLRTTSSFMLPAANPVTLLKQDMSAQVQQVYLSANTGQFTSEARDTAAFYGKEDVKYLLDNYTRFKTMEEVLREYVQPVGVSRRAGRFHTYIFDQVTRRPFTGAPLVLLDGVPVFDANKLMDYDPLKVERIAVVSKKYFQGRSVFDGIITLLTYKGDLEGYELDPNATVHDYDGLQLQRQFYSPVYETAEQKQDHLPDYRNVLLWKPDVKANMAGKADVEFYTSDLSGQYEVVIQGITSDGRCGWSKLIFTIN